MLENFPFKFEEFNISGNDIPAHVATRILIYHILPVIPVREELGIPMWPSLQSCWRPYKWEIKQGRPGTSEHCFGQLANGSFEMEHKGACDWTCKDFQSNKDKLLASLIKNTEYTRFAVYGTFIHSDYAKTKSGSREVYNEKWVSQYKIK